MIRTLLTLALLAVAATVSAAEEKGFEPIFDGQTLEGWQGDTDGYFVEDNAIVCDPEKGGFLYTDDQYSDFVLRFEFKLPPGANNGLGVRVPRRGNPAYAGMELQVLDNTSPKYAKLKPYQYHGSVYGVAAAKRGFLKPTGEWNQQEVIVDGRRVKVVLNGETIVDVDLDEASTPQTPDGRPHPGLSREKGHICFCGHGARVEFRNLRLKRLDD